MIGFTKFEGSAPANSAVEVIDGEGKALAKTKADINGEWTVESVGLPVGRHSIRASAQTPTGCQCESQAVNVIVEAEQPPQQETDSDGEWATDDALRERAKYHYCTLVEALANGFKVDRELRTWVLNLVGKSMDDFRADVAEWCELTERQPLSRSRLQSHLDTLRD